MQFLNVAKKYFIDSQIYVSLMGTALAVFFMLEQNVLRWPTVLLIFITYFSGYLYTKYQKHRHFSKILAFNVICGVLSGALILMNHNEVRLLKWLCIVALGLLYNSFFLETFIRKIPLLKVFYVGFTWALVNSWLILPEFNPGIFTISMLIVTALVLPFDIRDMNDDDVITFPRLIGVLHTKYLAYLLVSAGALVSVFTLEEAFMVSFLFTSLITAILIYFSENSNNDSYFSIGVESCSALPLLLYIFYLYSKF